MRCCSSLATSASSASLAAVMSISSPWSTRRAVRPFGHRGIVEDPDDRAVTPRHSVFEALRHAGYAGGSVRDQHGVAVVGMDAARPELGVGGPLLRRVAQHRLQLRAHEVPATGRSRLGDVHHAGLALDQRLVSDLRARELALDLELAPKGRLAVAEQHALPDGDGEQHQADGHDVDDPNESARALAARGRPSGSR